MTNTFSPFLFPLFLHDVFFDLVLSTSTFVIDERRGIVAFLSQNVAQFIKHNNWPPKSPDLNQVDYRYSV